MFDLEKLLNSDNDSQSEDEDPNAKFKSAIVFGALPALEFEQVDDCLGLSPKNLSKKNSRNHSSRNLANIIYHNDGQSTHVSSRESCVDADQHDTVSPKQLLIESKKPEKQC